VAVKTFDMQAALQPLNWVSWHFMW